MGYIKEPRGIDFIIQSKPLTNEERKEISKFIRDYKKKMLRRNLLNLKLQFQKQKVFN